MKSVLMMTDEEFRGIMVDIWSEETLNKKITLDMVDFLKLQYVNAELLEELKKKKSFYEKKQSSAVLEF